MVHFYIDYIESLCNVGWSDKEWRVPEESR